MLLFVPLLGGTCSVLEPFTRTYPLPGDQHGTILLTGDGGFLIAGATGQYPDPYPELLFLRLDPNGALLWTTSVPRLSSSSGTSATVLTADGGVAHVGAVTLPDAADQDIEVFRLSPDGELLWRKTVVLPGWQSLAGAAETPLGLALVAFHKAPGATESDLLYARLDDDGNVVAQNAIVRPGDEKVGGVVSLGDGRLVLVGGRAGSGWFVTLDVGGEVVGETSFQSCDTEGGHSLVESPAGGFITTGVCASGARFSYKAIKLSPFGTLEWSAASESYLRAYDTVDYVGMALEPGGGIVLSTVEENPIASPGGWGSLHRYGPDGEPLAARGYTTSVHYMVSAPVAPPAGGTAYVSRDYADSGSGGESTVRKLRSDLSLDWESAPLPINPVEPQLVAEPSGSFVVFGTQSSASRDEDFVVARIGANGELAPLSN